MISVSGSVLSVLTVQIFMTKTVSSEIIDISFSTVISDITDTSDNTTSIDIIDISVSTVISDSNNSSDITVRNDCN